MNKIKPKFNIRSLMNLKSISYKLKTRILKIKKMEILVKINLLKQKFNHSLKNFKIILTE